MMKTNLLASLMAAFLLTATAQAESQLCMPEVDYQSYACISKVELNGVISESSTGVPGETVFAEDYTGDPARLFKVEAGQTYTLKVTFSNFNSGALDHYQLTAFFDWNNDKVFQGSERCTDQKFSAGRAGGLLEKTFEVKVPADATTGKAHMRVLVFYHETGYPVDPCNWFESGNQEDYLIEILEEGSANVESPKPEKALAYPNPASDVVYVDASVSQYALYSANGSLIRQGQPVGQQIDLSGNAPGAYLLKMQTDEGTKILQLMIK